MKLPRFFLRSLFTFVFAMLSIPAFADYTYRIYTEPFAQFGNGGYMIGVVSGDLIDEADSPYSSDMRIRGWITVDEPFPIEGEFSREYTFQNSGTSAQGNKILSFNISDGVQTISSSMDGANARIESWSNTSEEWWKMRLEYEDQEGDSLYNTIIIRYYKQFNGIVNGTVTGPDLYKQGVYSAHLVKIGPLCTNVCGYGTPEPGVGGAAVGSYSYDTPKAPFSLFTQQATRVPMLSPFSLALLSFALIGVGWFFRRRFGIQT